MTSDRERYHLRMFPDYADSVLWAPGVGPVPYDDLGLDAELEHDLRAWDDSSYAALVDDELHDEVAARRLTDEGFALGRRVADTLGERFGVEVQAFVAGEPARTFRGRGPGWNPTAESALAAIIDEEVAQQQRIQALRSAGATFEWRA